MILTVPRDEIDNHNLPEVVRGLVGGGRNGYKYSGSFVESAKTMQRVILKRSPVPISTIFANRVRATQTQTRSGSYFNPCKTNRCVHTEKTITKTFL